MYHVKNDKRSKKSALLIIEGLKESMRTKKFEDISITEIHNNAMVGRATFYRLFDCKEDVLCYAYELNLHRNLEEYKAIPEKERMPFFEYCLKTILESDLLVTIVQQNQIGCLYEIHNRNILMLSGLIPKELELDSNSLDYMSASITGIIMGIVSVWIKHGKRESAEELYNEFKKHLLISVDII